ncbi:MAG: penicillin acylase family protein, partial [Actinomycetota bacterium]|nr:penicillin acylase family protein [Actinomycetota bacterium]
MKGLRGTIAFALASAALIACAAPAAGQVQPYRANDFGGFRNILPPGQGHNATISEILVNQLTGATPPQWDNQRNLYGDLVYQAPNLSNSQVDQYFKDGSFGVLPADAGVPYSPRPGVTVVRDSVYGVPHIYGASRADAIFGSGYVGAQDRLFFMDALRHSGRAELSEFAGGSNKAMDAEVWDNAPYTEADLQRQYDLADETYGAEGAQLQEDVRDYVAGVNQFISEAALNPLLVPGEYALLGKTLEPWKVTDVIATAALVGGIFGKGGGGEVSNAEVYSAARARFGKVKGVKVWRDLRRANDPEAPTTVEGRSFPYQQRKPRAINPKAVAIPDRGSLVPGSPDDASDKANLAAAADTRQAPITTPNGGSALSGGILGGLEDIGGSSNALLVSARE